MTERMPVAGVGNIFLGDDGFGIEVVRRLASIELPDWVTVACEPATADYGIGLSAPVAAAVDEAVRVVLDLIAADSGRAATGGERSGADRLNAAGPGDGRPSIAESGEGRRMQACPGEDQ